MADFYSKNYESLTKKYESLSAETVNRDWLHFMPANKSLVLDIGSGSGRDAAWLAGKGHEVVAVEPCIFLREKAQELHPEPSIQWLDDSLPALREVCSLDLRFDLILVNAVWMHIAPKNRKRSFRKLVELMRTGGTMIITLRQGPSQDERIMFPVGCDEIHEFAKKYALEIVSSSESIDQFGRPEIFWNTLVLQKTKGSGPYS